MESSLCEAIAAGVLQEIHRPCIAHQLLNALAFLHASRVVHRDVKPANVLINSDCHVRLCDFGLARSLAQEDTHNGGGKAAPALTDYVNMRWYRAPEVLLGFASYSEGVDI